MYRIILADEHPIVRIGVREILDTTLDLAIVDEAINGKELLDKIVHNNYDAVLFDIFALEPDGFEILKEIRRMKNKLPVLIFSIYPEEQYAIRVLRAGASGFINKEASPELLIDAIRRIVKGGKYISPQIAERIADGLDVSDSLPMHEKLTDREFQIFCLIASGHKLREIAKKLSLSINTINSYRIIILDKMCMKSNVEITHYALKNRLVE